jgi:hypothetical protein
MSITITDEQQELVNFYLRALHEGIAYGIMESRQHHGVLTSLLAALGGKPEPESIENVIRNQLRAWSPPSCP